MVMKKHNVNVVPLLVQFEKENGSIKDMDGNDIRLQEFRAKLGFNRLISNRERNKNTGMQYMVLDNPELPALDLTAIPTRVANEVRNIVQLLQQGIKTRDIAGRLNLSESHIGKVISIHKLKMLKYRLCDDQENVLLTGTSLTDVYEKMVKLGYFNRSLDTFIWRLHSEKMSISDSMKLTLTKLFLVRKLSKKSCQYSHF